MGLKLILVDFDAGIAGVEGLAHWPGYAPDKRDYVYYDGGCRAGVIVRLDVLSALARRVLTRADIDCTITLPMPGISGVREAQYILRPCAQGYIRYHIARRAIAHDLILDHSSVAGLVEGGRVRHRWRQTPAQDRERHAAERAIARRKCISWRRNSPGRTWFAKGRCYVDPPAGAVARVGGRESSVIVMLDRFARPLAAYTYAGDWRHTYTVGTDIPRRLEWSQVRPLGVASAEVCNAS